MGCFPQGSQSSEDDLRELIKEATEAARDDYDAQSAVTWAEGYEFPALHIQSDVACLRAAQLDFETMVRRRLQILSPDRLSKERVVKLRPDNPEHRLMFDLVVGMKVFRPAGFVANRSLPRTPLRSSYDIVAPAVNKMLGAVVEQRLAFLLPLELASEDDRRDKEN